MNECASGLNELCKCKYNFTSCIIFPNGSVVDLVVFFKTYQFQPDHTDIPILKFIASIENKQEIILTCDLLSFFGIVVNNENMIQALRDTNVSLITVDENSKMYYLVSLAPNQEYVSINKLVNTVQTRNHFARYIEECEFFKCNTEQKKVYEVITVSPFAEIVQNEENNNAQRDMELEFI